MKLNLEMNKAMQTVVLDSLSMIRNIVDGAFPDDMFDDELAPCALSSIKAIALALNNLIVDLK